MEISELQRIEKMKDRYNCYSDNYKDLVENKLGLIYTSFQKLGLDVQLHHSTNLYKMIINNISKVYDYGISRQFKNENFNDIYEELEVDKTMNQVNKYLNAFNDVILQVGWDDEEEELKLIIRLPHKTKIEWVDRKVFSVSYFVEYDTETKQEKWAYWSKTEHYYITKDPTKKEDGKEPIAGNEEMVNPYGFLPFVFFNNGYRDESFWDMYKGDDLFNSTIDISIHLTFLNHIIKSQSFKQLVGSGSNLSELNGSVLDPLTVLTLEGQDTEISVLDLQANYDQLWKVLQEQANSLATSYNISPSSFRMTGQVSSGFALQMENHKLDTFIKSQQVDFTKYEKKLFKIICKMIGVHTKTEIENNFQIDFVKPFYPISEIEQMDLDLKGTHLGTSSPVDILKEKLNITEEEALSKYRDNIKYRNESFNKLNEEIVDIDFDI